MWPPGMSVTSGSESLAWMVVCPPTQASSGDHRPSPKRLSHLVSMPVLLYRTIAGWLAVQTLFFFFEGAQVAGDFTI